MIAYWNLPESAYRDVRESDQLRVMAEDENVRIVRNRRWDTWQLVRRCAPNDSFVCLDGAYRIPGWWPFGTFRGDNYNIGAMIRHMKATDNWSRANDRRESVRKFVDKAAHAADEQLAEQRRDALDEAAGAATERFYQEGRYFGPREAPV